MIDKKLEDLILTTVRKQENVPADIDIYIGIVLDKNQIFDRVEQHIHNYRHKRCAGGSTLWTDDDPDEPNTRLYVAVDDEEIKVINTIDRLLAFLNNRYTLFQIDIENGLD